MSQTTITLFLKSAEQVWSRTGSLIFTGTLSPPEVEALVESLRGRQPESVPRLAPLLATADGQGEAAGVHVTGPARLEAQGGTDAHRVLKVEAAAELAQMGVAGVIMAAGGALPEEWYDTVYVTRPVEVAVEIDVTAEAAWAAMNWQGRPFAVTLGADTRQEAL